MSFITRVLQKIMGKTVNIHEAKTHLSRLLEDVAAGEEVVIAKAGKPVAKLIAIKPVHQRRPGLTEGRVTDVFFEPLPPEELEPWQQ